jgi:hypothetical protein
MAEPLRLPAVRLPWENSIIYFVTICVKDFINELPDRGICQLPLEFKGVGAG